MKDKHVVLTVAAIALPVAVFCYLLSSRTAEWETLKDRSGATLPIFPKGDSRIDPEARDPLAYWRYRGVKFHADLLRESVVYFPPLDKKNDPRKFMMFEDGYTFEISRAGGRAAFYHDGVREAVPTWRVPCKDGIGIIKAVLEACIKIEKAKEEYIESNR